MMMRGGGPLTMDPLFVMLGCLICTLTALIFVEVRRIRKRLDKTSQPASVTTERRTTAAV
jgi:hypothetical protein